MENVSPSTSKGSQRWRFAAGFTLAVFALLVIGEIGLRVVPPRAVQPYLPNDNRPGPFRSDPVYGVQYKSWEAFQADYADAFKANADLFTQEDQPKNWAMFGSSFVHAPKMLADTSRQYIPNRRVFNLGRNEVQYVRAAQMEMVLEHGLRPERIVYALMPLDISVFAKQGFAMVRASEGGAMAFDPRLPSIGGAIVRNSRLAFSGWVRAELQNNVPFYKPSEMTRRMDSRIVEEVDYLFARLGELSQRYHVPITVLLIPNHEQITKGAGFAFQDELTRIAREKGLDVLDVRDSFCDYPDKPALFIPDKHFSDLGNRILLSAFVKHLHALGEAKDVTLPEGFPG